MMNIYMYTSLTQKFSNLQYTCACMWPKGPLGHRFLHINYSCTYTENCTTTMNWECCNRNSVLCYRYNLCPQLNMAALFCFACVFSWSCLLKLSRTFHFNPLFPASLSQSTCSTRVRNKTPLRRLPSSKFSPISSFSTPLSQSPSTSG